MASKRGGAPKRNVLEMQQDLHLTMQLYLKGLGPRAIAIEVCKDRHYTLHETTIAKDISKCLTQWEKERLHLIDKHKTIELAKLNQLEAVYWESWENSKRDRTKNIIKKSGPVASPTYVQMQDETQTSIGDDKWLQGIERCIAQRCKIMGLDNGVIPEGVKTDNSPREIVFKTRKREPEFTEAIEVDDEPRAVKQIPQNIK